MPRETEADRLVRRQKAQQEAIIKAEQAEQARYLADQRATDLQELNTLIPQLLKCLREHGYPFMQTIRVEDRKPGPAARMFDLQGWYDKAGWYLFTTSMWYVDGYTKSDHYFLSDGRFYSDGLFHGRPMSVHELARNGGSLHMYVTHLQELLERVEKLDSK